MSHKWTEGEVRRIVDGRDGSAALEILSELIGKGQHVVKWGDLSDPEAERDARLERELRESDAADGIF